MKKESKGWTEKTTRLLRAAADELEEFNLKVNLGKMEARSLYDDLKKKYRFYLQTVKQRANTISGFTQDKIQRLKKSIQELNDKINAESDVQKTSSIVTAIRNFRQQIRDLKVPEEYKQELEAELEKFQIKLKIIRLRFADQKISSRQKWTQQTKKIRERIDRFKNRMMQSSETRVRNQRRSQINKRWAQLKRVFSAR